MLRAEKGSKSHSFEFQGHFCQLVESFKLKMIKGAMIHSISIDKHKKKHQRKLNICMYRETLMWWLWVAS